MRNKSEIEKAIKKSDFDWYGRKTFIEDFSKYILSQDESQHICINGVWGSGKTTTILGLIEHLESSENTNEKPLILYLDAWKLEHYEHPLFSLLKVMESEKSSIFEKIKDDLGKKSIELQIGVSTPIFSVNATTKNVDTVDRILTSAECIDVLNEMMIIAVKKYKEEKNNKLIIFIDELDRAKPDFTLKTIEMFHHLQDDLPTHVVYSVDVDQLSSVIKHYYGYEYNAEIFTHKVFDTVIPLKKLSDYGISTYISNALSKLDVTYRVDKITGILLDYMEPKQRESLRTINKITSKISLNLASGYFGAANSHYSDDYYLIADGAMPHLWGYIELLIAIQVLSLTDPLAVKHIAFGNKVEILYNLLAKRKTKKVWELLTDSYNYGILASVNERTSSNIDEKEAMEGLGKIFIPPESKDGYYNKPVFSEIEF